MNLLKEANLSVNLCTSFTLVSWSGMSSLILSGFTLIPLCETKNPKNIPESTPNTHFFGLSFMLCFLRMSKVSQSCFKLSAPFKYLTNMPSIYTSIVLPICFSNILINEPLINSSGVLKPKWHHIVTICSKIRFERNFFLILRVHFDFIVPEVSIKVTH